MTAEKSREAMALSNRKMASVLLVLSRDYNIQPGTTALWLGRVPETVFDKLNEQELVEMVKVMENAYQTGLQTGSDWPGKWSRLLLPGKARASFKSEAASL